MINEPGPWNPEGIPYNKFGLIPERAKPKIEPNLPQEIAIIPDAVGTGENVPWMDIRI